MENALKMNKFREERNKLSLCRQEASKDGNSTLKTISWPAKEDALALLKLMPSGYPL